MTSRRDGVSQNGKAGGITAELTDRDQVPEVGKQLAAEHADGTLLVNAAGFLHPEGVQRVRGGLAIGCAEGNVGN
jgi:hypothetical protein